MNIDSKDLMIGNLVLTNDDGVETIHEVQSIVKVPQGEKINGFAGDYVVLDKGVTTLIKDIYAYENEPDYLVYGVPLSEEILLDCGFERQISSLETKRWYYVIYIGEISIRLYGSDYDSNFWQFGNQELYPPLYANILRIKYMHQLQNLIKALTNQELDVSKLTNKK